MASQSYAAAARQAGTSQNEGPSTASASHHKVENASNKPRRTSPSPSHIPQTGAAEEEVYILTLLTGKAHHQRMTELRRKYFPKHLNKLAAHLTLFHALPGSRLDSDIVPVIEDIARNTQPFSITAHHAFRLGRRSIAIDVPYKSGGAEAKQVRDALQEPWKQQGFLSEQDAGRTGRAFPHYTIMNKVDDEVEVQKALEELQRDFRPDRDVISGLGLYRYDRGFWRWVKNYDFAQAEREGGGGEKQASAGQES